MTPSDFRRLALALPSVVAGSHMGAEDFRVGGHIFATLAHADQGYGSLLLDAEHQAAFLAEAPDMFQPVPGGWGRHGATHIRLNNTDEATLAGALRTAWKLRAEKNSRSASQTKRRTGDPPGV